MPDGRRIYAIGDIHGRADLLLEMHDLILADAGSAGQVEKTALYLGDYVDRGMQSREVIDLLLQQSLADFRHIFLMGNHEDFMLDFYGSGERGPYWLHNGGLTTLKSYGVDVPAGTPVDSDLPALQSAFRAALPDSHLAFLRSLDLCHIAGDYYFVHAGVNPRVPLDLQQARDQIWIRNEFLESNKDFGKVVVHGHSISYDVEQRHNRIGIDTGAFMSGKLTALALEGERTWLLQT